MLPLPLSLSLVRPYSLPIMIHRPSPTPRRPRPCPTPRTQLPRITAAPQWGPTSAAANRNCGEHPLDSGHDRAHRAPHRPPLGTHPFTMCSATQSTRAPPPGPSPPRGGAVWPRCVSFAGCLPVLHPRVRHPDHSRRHLSLPIPSCPSIALYGVTPRVGNFHAGRPETLPSGCVAFFGALVGDVCPIVLESASKVSTNKHRVTCCK